jgi:hypothetical protein
MLTQTLLDSRYAIVSWLTKHPQMLQALIIVAIVLVFTLLASSGVAYAMPSSSGCGSPGC